MMTSRDAAASSAPISNESHVIHVSDVLKPAPRIRWLVDEMLAPHTISTLFGETGAGKTFLAIDLACSIATGRSFHGRLVAEGRTVYVCGEGYSGLQKRLRAWEIERGIHLAEAPLWVLPEPLDMLSLKDVDRFITSMSGNHATGFQLVVIDTVDSCFGEGDDSSNADMRAFLGAVKRIRDELDCAVILVMHPGHSEIKRERGGSNLKGAVDYRLRVYRDAQLNVVLEALKCKDHEPFKSMVFKQRVVRLPTNDGHTPDSSCVLERLEGQVPARSSDTAVSASVNAGKKSLCAALKEHGKRADQISLETPEPPDGSTVLVLEKAWREKHYAPCAPESAMDSKEQNAKRKSFNRARGALRAAHLIGEADGYVWLLSETSGRNPNHRSSARPSDTP